MRIRRFIFLSNLEAGGTKQKPGAVVGRSWKRSCQMAGNVRFSFQPNKVCSLIIFPTGRLDSYLKAEIPECGTRRKKSHSRTNSVSLAVHCWNNWES